MSTGSAAPLIAPAQRGAYRRVQPRHAMDVMGRAEVMVETHHAVPQSDFDAPGMTHHMLEIGINACTRLRFGWDGEVHDGIYRTGDMMLLPAGRASRCRWDGVFGEALIVYFAPQFLHRLVEQDWDRDPARFELSGRPWFNDPAILQVGQMLRDPASARAAPGGRVLMDSLALALGALVLRAGTALKRPPMARGGLAPAVLARVVDYIEANLGQDIGLAELAAMAGCGLQHFKRAFKASTDEPPHQFLITRRIAQARLLLARGGLGIAEIGLACGFASQSHFSTAFRQRTGTTPARFRALARL